MDPGIPLSKLKNLIESKAPGIHVDVCHACRCILMYSISECMPMYVCVCMYVCMHACMYVCMHACRYVCMHVCMYVCM